MDFWRSIRKGPVSLGFEGMPLLMRVGIIGSTLFVGVWLLFVPFAALNLGTYTINDREVTGRYFLVHAYPFLLPFCGLMAAIAYGYWTERLWARPLAVWFWFAVDLLLLYLVVAGLVSSTDAVMYAFWAVAYVGAAWWYCYRKESVVRYYKALETTKSVTPVGA
jgi:hypothetical protein